MLGLEIPELKDIFKDELAVRGDWLVANLETNLSWPVAAQKVVFCGLEFWLLPLTKQSYPAVALNLEGLSRDDGQRRLLRLLSALSWHQGSGIMLAGFTGGSFPMPMGRDKTTGLVITADLDLTGLPEPQDGKAQLALALMREGRGLNHPGYAFLSFYRVLEVCIPAKRRKTWLTSNADRVQGHAAKRALDELKASIAADLGDHLYRSGRQAIAHASKDVIINPDEPNDSRRLRAELPIMQALAELAIETELGVQTPHTEWQQHLYELAGFRRLLGADLVINIAAGSPAPEGATVDLPRIDVELRRRAPYLPLENLAPLHAQQVDKALLVVFGSDDGLVRIEFLLDFAAERLRFDWEKGVYAADDGSAQSARNAAELTRFLRDYIGNGQMQIYDSDTRELLSRVDAFIPVNFWADHDQFNAIIAEWEGKAEARASG